MDRQPQRGDIITSWLMQILGVLAVLGFIAYEGLSIFLTSLSLDDNAREVARVARDAYREEGSLDHAEQSAWQVADLHGVVVVAVERDGDDLAVTLQRQAPTLVVHRVGPLEELTVATQTSRIPVRP